MLLRRALAQSTFSPSGRLQLLRSTMSSEPKTHLALLQEEAKGPLIARRVPTVSPEAHQIQVRVKAAGINPIDYKQFAYAYVTRNFPYIGGGDLGGVVTEVGSDVSHLKVGDRVSNVVFQFIEPMSSATFQEYSTADANVATKIPDSVSFSQAATISVTWFTAIVGLCHSSCLNLRWPGNPFPPNTTEAFEPILVWGAGSGIGRACVQILAQAGYQNIIATCAPNRFDDVKSAGAHQVFNYRDDNIVDQIKNFVGDEGVKTCYDPISTPASIEPISKIISPGGRVATVTPQGQDIIPFEGGPIKRIRTSLAIVVSRSNEEHRTFGRKASEYLEGALANGTYSFISFQELPGGLEGGGVQRGSDMLRLNENHGDKLVVVNI